MIATVALHRFDCNLKALCHAYLMSTLFQKFNQRGYRKYGRIQYHGVVHRDRVHAAQRFCCGQIE